MKHALLAGALLFAPAAFGQLAPVPNCSPYHGARLRYCITARHLGIEYDLHYGARYYTLYSCALSLERLDWFKDPTKYWTICKDVARAEDLRWASR